MRPVAPFIVAIMCLCLLTMQLSGVHLHVSVAHQSSTLHDAHLHNAGIDGHDNDHDPELDVSPFEPGVSWFKLIPFIVCLVFVLLASILASRTVWPPLLERLPERHRSRWRPPLRAPPQHTF
jgi:hypothetical protein